jgi:ABC-2 type transport system ATP-binding protein
LNLAMALVHDPEIVVLDEPEAGLDPQSRILVRETIHSMARQKTVILTTHNMDEAERLADRVAIIDHGKLLVVDTPERLKHTVGEGDVLEIEINGIPIEQTQQVVSSLNLEASFNNHSLVIRCLNIVEYLPVILEKLHDIGAQTSDVRLRANTLEDVFIRLTGRRLRE